METPNFPSIFLSCRSRDFLCQDDKFLQGEPCGVGAGLSPWADWVNQLEPGLSILYSLLGPIDRPESVRHRTAVDSAAARDSLLCP